MSTREPCSEVGVPISQASHYGKPLLDRENQRFEIFVRLEASNDILSPDFSAD